MTARFPLVRIPKRVMFVDDDGKMLDALRITTPADASREFINSPDAALQSLMQEMLYWSSIETLFATVQERRMDGFAEAAQYVNSYFQDWRRFHVTGVLIIDYNMPGVNGLELLRRISACPAHRVLLTGVADADVAVRAFNSGLIQKFIPKSTPDLYEEIRRSSDDTYLSVCEHMGRLMRGTLRNDQLVLLNEPSVIEGLARKAQELDWCEYVVIGQPFGILGMAHDGPLQWLQLETSETLAALSEAMQDLGYAAADVRATASGTAMAVSEIRQQLGLQDDRRTVDAEQISELPSMHCAILDLPLRVLTAKDYGLDDIRTPEELLRALLRDVLVAARRAEEDQAAHPAFAQAVSHLVSTAARSKFHGLALQSVRGTTAVPDWVSAHITAAAAMLRSRTGGP